MTFKPGITPEVGSWIVLPTIDFNDEPLFDTSKVGDELADCMLSAESAIGQLAKTKVPP